MKGNIIERISRYELFTVYSYSLSCLELLAPFMSPTVQSPGRVVWVVFGHQTFCAQNEGDSNLQVEVAALWRELSVDNEVWY